ncbi:HNH endonuclease signature motif containing protein [Agromyces mangrovi Wang et al. 2018]|uniref:HNH endonuclease signature motif containing protein n=1 Tax=Agromyces mangrovi TaxID=1858653 RepID=UPI002573141D|nr:HNH endonuclease signature motif containing protein [Agromyces mangrovi]BDZ63744.1 HNH endonuclease [Agromyces mangrovi]
MEEAGLDAVPAQEALPPRLPAPDEIDIEWQLLDDVVDEWRRGETADAAGMPVDARREALLDLHVTEIAALTAQLERVAARRASLIAAAHRESAAIEEERAAVREREGLRVEPPRRRAELVRRSLTAEIACATRTTEATVARWIGDAEALADGLGATLAAALDGRISYLHARTIADEVGSLPASHRADFEAEALRVAATTTPGRFRRRARLLRERMHPDSIEARAADASSARHVRIEPDRDGMAWLTAHLTAATAARIDARLTDTAGHLRALDGEERTTAQLRADVLAGLLLGEAQVSTSPEQTSSPLPAARRGIRPVVSVTVPAARLLGHGDEPAVLDGYGPIPIDDALELVGASGSLRRLLTEPETGAVLSVGRERYTVPPDLRARLRVRDGTCRFPGCDRRADASEIDHTRDWAAGGETAHDNLAHLCARHHHLIHEAGWRVVQRGGRVLEWRSPLGREYTTEPAEPMSPAREPGSERECDTEREPEPPF